MKRAALIALAVSAALAQCNAWAQDKGETAAKQGGCLNCHTVDAKKVGPSFKDVATKNKAGGADAVIAAVRAKPVHAAGLKSLKDENLRAIAGWIVALAK